MSFRTELIQACGGQSSAEGVLPAHPLASGGNLTQPECSGQPASGQEERARLQGAWAHLGSCAGPGPALLQPGWTKCGLSCWCERKGKALVPRSIPVPTALPKVALGGMQSQMRAEPGGLDSRPMQSPGAGAGVLRSGPSLGLCRRRVWGHDNIMGALPQTDVKLST